jgi:SagB-type dehydrogenase family enzyme
MKINYGKVFQNNSNQANMLKVTHISKDKNLWPSDWKNVEYKNYNTHKVYLPSPQSKSFDNKTLFYIRSRRDFCNHSITLQELSNILYYSLGEYYLPNGEVHRPYPSAGARYPIEIYIFNFNIVELKKDHVYYYNQREHCLQEVIDYKDKKDFCKFDNIDLSSCLIVLTMIADRTVRKYGDRGYRYAYIEAGAILELLHLNSNVNQTKSCIAGAIDEVKVENLLNLDPEIEAVISSIIIGK